MADGARDFAAVFCSGDWMDGGPSCGLVTLSFDEYQRQMAKPDHLWCCPNCGSTATYDDRRSEELQGVSAPIDDDEEVPR